MRTRLLNLWDRIQSSFWFLPTFLVVLAAGTGIVLPAAERSGLLRLGNASWLVTTPDGARSALSAIAGAMITVAGVVFSVTMLTLSIAASQFGSRVLRSRMRDRATQLALGTFLGTSVYCFLVMVAIRGGEGSQFVPQVSVALGIFAAVCSLFVLIFFIHGVSEAVRAPYVIARLAADLTNSIERLYPEEVGRVDEDSEEADEDARRRLDGDAVRSIKSMQEGYVQAVDGDTLLEVATEQDLLIELRVRPGDFVARGDLLARVAGGSQDSADLEETINDALIVGNMRTPRQDVNCAVHELAQLSVRALSPGINDPFTAMNGIDRLAAALGRLAERKIPSRYRRDGEGRVRVIAHRPALPDALAAAFNQIRQNARSAPPVGVRLLEGLESLAGKVRRQSDRQAVLQHAKLVYETYRKGDHLEVDLRGIREQYDRVVHYLAIDRPLREEGAAKSPPADVPAEQSDADESASAPPETGEVNG